MRLMFKGVGVFSLMGNSVKVAAFALSSEVGDRWALKVSGVEFRK